MSLEAAQQNKYKLYNKRQLQQMERKTPEYSTQEMTLTEFQDNLERKKSQDKESINQQSSKMMFYKIMKSQQNIFTNCLQPSSCVQKTSYWCSAQQAQNQQEDDENLTFEEQNSWKLANGCVCISNQNRNEEKKDTIDSHIQKNQLQLRNFVISPGQSESFRKYISNTDVEHNVRKNGLINIEGGDQIQRNTGYFGSREQLNLVNFPEVKNIEENEIIAQELRENDRSTLEIKGSFENEKIIVQTSSPDRYRRKNQQYQRMLELQPEYLPSNNKFTKQLTNNSSMSMTQYSTSNLHNQDPSPKNNNQIYKSLQNAEYQKLEKKVNFQQQVSLRKQKLSQTDDNSNEAFTKILTNDFTDKKNDFDNTKDQEQYLFNSQFTQNQQQQSNNKTHGTKIKVQDLRIDKILRVNDKQNKNKKEQKLQKYQNIKQNQKNEKKVEKTDLLRDNSKTISYRSARKQRLQQILQNTETSLEGLNMFPKALNYSQFFSTGKKSSEFDNIKPEKKIERFSYQLQLPLLNGNIQNKKMLRLKQSLNKSEEKESLKSAMTINVNLKKKKLETDKISIIDQEVQKLQISKVSFPFSIAEKSQNKDLKLQLNVKQMQCISEKKLKEKKHEKKIKLQKKQKNFDQFNDQIVLTHPDELSKSYEQAIQILSSYSALRSPNQIFNSQQSRKKSNSKYQYATQSMPSEYSIYQKVLYQRIQQKRSCSNQILSIEGFKTSEKDINVKQFSNIQQNDQSMNKKEEKKITRKAMSNQKSLKNDKNLLINIPEFKQKQNRNLNSTQISIRNSKALNTSKNKNTNNWNLSHRSIKYNIEVQKAGVKNGTAVIIMNLDEDRQSKRNQQNSQSQKSNSERKLSAPRCEACQSKSNKKTLDLSIRAESNQKKQKIIDKSESRLDKSNISAFKKSQITDKQSKDIQISMVKFNQMINEEIEKSRLKIEKNNQILRSSSKNNQKINNSSPSIIPQNEVFLASVQNQSPYLTIKQQNEIFENNQFFDIDVNSNKKQIENLTGDNNIKLIPEQNQISKIRDFNEQMNDVQNSENDFLESAKQYTNIIKTIRNKLPYNLNKSISLNESLISQQEILFLNDLKDINTPIYPNKLNDIIENKRIKKNEMQRINHSENIKDYQSSATSKAKYQDLDISKYFYPKLENQQQSIFEKDQLQNIDDKYQQQQTLKLQKNSSESKLSSEQKLRKIDLSNTDKKLRKQNCSITNNQDYNNQYEHLNKKKWIEFSDQSNKNRNADSLIILQKKENIAMKQQSIFESTFDRLTNKFEPSQNSQTIDKNTNIRDKLVLTTTNKTNFSSNDHNLFNADQKNKTLSQNSNDNEEYQSTNIKLIQNNQRAPDIAARINNDNIPIFQNNYNLEQNNNKTEIMKINQSNKLIETSKKFQYSTYKLQENEYKPQNRSISLEKRIKMFQDSLSEKLSVSCKNQKDKKVQNNLVNQKLDINNKIVLNDQTINHEQLGQSELNRQSIFYRTEKPENVKSVLQKMFKKNSIITEKSNEVSLKDRGSTIQKDENVNSLRKSKNDQKFSLVMSQNNFDLKQIDKGPQKKLDFENITEIKNNNIDKIIQ